MKINWKATQKHSENLTESIEMLLVILEEVQAEKYSEAC